MTVGLDLQRLSENERIRAIGEGAKTQLVGAMIEDNLPHDPKRVKRYIKKITEQFPDVKHVDTKPLTRGIALVRFAPKATH